MDKDKLYRISIFEEEKFKRYVAKLGVDDLEKLKGYLDRVMPTAKKVKGVNFKIRLANYKYLTEYMADEQTINQLKLEKQKKEQKKSSMEKLRRMADGEMKHVTAKYRTAQNIPVRIILTTGEHYYVTMESSIPWRTIMQIHDNGVLGSSGVFECEEILSPDSYKEISKFDLESGKSLVIRNSQIIGMLVDEETMMANINDFVSELQAVAGKYNLSDFQIAQYFRN